MTREHERRFIVANCIRVSPNCPIREQLLTLEIARTSSAISSLSCSFSFFLARLIAQFAPPDSFIAGFGSLLSVTTRVRVATRLQAPDRYEAQFSFCKKLSTKKGPRRVAWGPLSKSERAQGWDLAHDQHAPCTLRAVSLGLDEEEEKHWYSAKGSSRKSCHVYDILIVSSRNMTLLLRIFTQKKWYKQRNNTN